MPTTDYRGWLNSAGALEPKHVRTINKVASIVSGDVSELQRRSGGDPGNINDTVDALLDEFIASCRGDARLALFSALCAYGTTMRMHFGPVSGA